MEQQEQSLDTKNQVFKGNPKAAKGQQEPREDGDSIVREEAKSNGELLVTDGLAANELNAKIAELQSQLDARGDLLRECETEIAGLKMKMESQIESLQAYVEISESVGRTENELKARIADLERQLEPQLHERDEALETKESVMRQQEQKYQGEINELLGRLNQKECLLKELEATMAGIRHQAKSQSQLQGSVKQTENELKAKIADLEKQLAAGKGIIAARDVEVSELKTQADPQIQFLKHQFHEREDEIRAKESALQQQEEKYQGEINELRSQLGQKESLLKEREEAIAGVREQAKSQNELLELEMQTENKLKEQIADLEWQLGAKDEILAERNAEVSDFKKKVVSQIQSLETQLRARDETLKTKESALQQQEEKYQGGINELQNQLSQKESLLKEREEAIVDVREQTQTQADILAAHLQAEDEMKTKIVDLELQMEAEKGILAKRDTEVLDCKKKAEPQIQSLEAQLQERDETLQTKEFALQQLEARYQGEINALMDQLSQKENLLTQRDEAMAGVKNKSSSHVALLKVVKRTGEELKVIRSLILRRQWGPRLGI